MFPCKERIYIYITGAHRCVHQLNLSGEDRFKALDKTTTRLQNSISQKLLLILKSVHLVHHMAQQDPTVHQPKNWACTDAFLSWTPATYLKTSFGVCKESIHALCSQEIRYWIQIWFEEIKWQLQLTSRSVTSSLSGSIRWSVVVANLLEIYSLGRLSKQIESKANDKRE